MSVFRDFFVKEKPVFTGIARGVGGFSFGSGGGGAGGAAAGSVSASGGAVQEYTDGSTTYRVHIFANGDSDFVNTSGPGLIDVMVMGGGGSGSTTQGDQDAGKGGGGAGGLAWASAIPVSPGTTCPVTVGAGGRGHYGGNSGATRVGRNGSNSVFAIPSGPYTITGAGGGGGGVSDSSPSPVSPTRVPNTNTNSGSPGGSGGGSGARNSGDGGYSGGPATQPGLNPGMPWVSNYGTPGGNATSSPSGAAGGGGGTGAGGSSQNSAGNNDGGPGGAGKSDFVGPVAQQKAFFLGTKGLGMGSSSDPHAYATPASSTVYFGGGGSGAPGTSGSNYSYPIALGGLGGGGRAGLGRNVQQNSPNLNSTLPSAYWYQIGGANHHGGGGGGGADDPLGPGNRRTSGGFAGRGGHGVVVVRYEYTAGTNDTFVAATGGTTSTDGDYKIHKFDGSGTSNTPNTFTVTQKAGDPKDNTIEVLVVGGGGSGGKWSGGGGGAGGVAHTYNYSLEHPAFTGSGPWAIPLQSGGGGAAQTISNPGNVGGDSFFGPTSLRVYALGGGGGGVNRAHPVPATTYQSMDGGSGGGGSTQDINSRAGFGHQRDIFGADPGAPLYSNKLQYNEKTVIYNYGNAGGQSPTDGNADMGGGGGAGAAGNDGGPGSGYSAGNSHGGAGIAISITGSPVLYGGGGTGATPPNSEAGGPGGGGQGGGSSAGGAGTDGLGGGGGGCYSGGPQSGRGGAGTVIVRYKYQ